MGQLLAYGFQFSFALFAFGSLVSLVFSKREIEGHGSQLAHLIAAAGALVALAFSVAVIMSGTAVSLQAGTLGIANDVLSFRIDALAAFFIATIATVALAASIYDIGYQKQFIGTHRLAHFGFFFNLFLAGMIGTVAADNALLFLFMWEAMAFASYFLVIFERTEENVAAGYLYILISQLGAAFLFAAFFLIHTATGSWDFEALRANGSTLPTVLQHVILALALVGFGSKAGIIPLHIWLPEAHPAAPSHVSALMSGVMIKTAIFMFIRFFVEFFPNHISWGLAILTLGAISSLLGVLYALSEHDLKRLLAFHSVENIGIIFLGVGASIVFFGYNQTALGFLALVAGLYHTVNHALFKSLLFLSAGSVVHATGTRNMEEYGGLIRLLPYTSFFFLVGAVAISGLPPFNGFVSEWLTFQGLFAGIITLPSLAKSVFLLGVASLAFTGGLAAACFVKAFGVTFLARPRGHLAHVHESSVLMKLAMGFLAILTLVFGIGAGAITPVIARIAGAPTENIAIASMGSSVHVGTFASLSMPEIAFALVALLMALVLFVYIVSRHSKTVVSRTWDCGSPLSPRMEVTATGFSRSIITVFRGLLRPSMQRSAEYHDATMRYFARSRMVHLSVPNIYRLYLYQPAADLIEQSALRIRHIQSGNLNLYLLYILLTVAGLLLWALS